MMRHACRRGTGGAISPRRRSSRSARDSIRHAHATREHPGELPDGGERSSAGGVRVGDRCGAEQKASAAVVSAVAPGAIGLDGPERIGLWRSGRTTGGKAKNRQRPDTALRAWLRAGGLAQLAWRHRIKQARPPRRAAPAPVKQEPVASADSRRKSTRRLRALGTDGHHAPASEPPPALVDPLDAVAEVGGACLRTR